MTDQKALIEKLKAGTDAERKQCISLLQEHLNAEPLDVVAWYDLASCFDYCGFETEAEPCYHKVYELGWNNIIASEQAGFLLGFGSTLRNNLKFELSEKLLQEGVTNFPNYPALKVFLAFTQYSQGRFKEAAQSLFQSSMQMPEKSFDGYERALKYYAENLDTHPVAESGILYDLDKIKIRAANPQDAAEIANVHLNSWREAYKGQLDPDFLDGLPFSFKARKTHWEKTMAKGPGNLFVAESLSGIVGFVSVNIPARDEAMSEYAEVGAIYLLARHKGKKAGLHLLKAAFAAVQKAGFSKAYCWMLKGNPTGHFYESTGAQLNGKEKIAQINGKDEVEVMYIWGKLL